MSDADPLSGATTYEILGVSPEDSRDRIEYRKNQLIDEYRERMVNAQRRDDTDEYSEAVDALRAIDDAWEWIRGNHEPSVPLVDPQPFDGETPYEVLGITEQTPPQRVRNRHEDLVEEYRERMIDAQRRDNADDYKEAADALRAVDEAYDALELEAVAPSPAAVLGHRPHEVLGVREGPPLKDAAERRDELLAEYTAELSVELYERDPWRFRQLVSTIERIDDAWTTLTSHNDTPEN